MGRYVVITHQDGSQTLYAHLIPESTDHLIEGVTEVSPTDVIGQAGVSGGVTGPHLHLEYSPTGRIFVKRSLVDPHPCVLAGQAPPEPLVLNPQNPTLVCGPDASVTFTASGGRPGPNGYTWSVSNPDAVIAVTGVNKRNMVLKPPVNEGGFDENIAYKKVAEASNSQVCSVDYFRSLAYGCNDAQIGTCTSNSDPIAQGSGIVCKVNPGDCTQNPSLPLCSSFGDFDNCDYVRAAGKVRDVRNQDMLAPNSPCKPCLPEMQGTVVTVSDAAGAPADTQVVVQ